MVFKMYIHRDRLTAQKLNQRITINQSYKPANLPNIDLAKNVLLCSTTLVNISL